MTIHNRVENDDELYEIFTFLPISSLFHSASLVSKQWHRLALAIPLDISFKNRKMLNNFINNNHDDHDEDMKNSKNIVEIRNLNIRSVNARYMRDPSFKLLISRKEFENVEELDFSHSIFDISNEKNDNNGEGFVWNFPKLKRFYLNEVRLGEGLAKSIRNSSSLSNLQVLEVKSIGLVRFQVECITSSDVLKNLTVLNISENILEEDGCELLLQSKFNNSLTSLNLYSCSPEYNEFTQGISKYFTRILSTFPNLTDLNYGRNNLRDEDLLKVENMGKLTSLDLGLNLLTAESVSFFKRPIFNNVTNLKCHGNRLEDFEFYQMVKKNPTMHKLKSIFLFIQHEDIDYTEMFYETFADFQLENVTSLVVINYLADNTFINLPVFGNLTNLELIASMIHAVGKLSFENCTFLRHLTSLTLNNISGIDFNSLDAHALNLKSLNLIYCAIDLKLLLNCCFFPNLTRLDFSYCEIPESDIQFLAQSGKTKQLITFSLEEFSSTLNSDYFADNLENFKNLEHLNICPFYETKFEKFPKLTAFNGKNLF